jgi:hypothetical protein
MTQLKTALALGSRCLPPDDVSQYLEQLAQRSQREDLSDWDNFLRGQVVPWGGIPFLIGRLSEA